VPARVAGRGRYSQAFLQAIDQGLQVRPQNRPQTMAEWLAWLDAPEPVAAVAPPSGSAANAASPERATAAAAPAEATAPTSAASRPAWLMPALAGAAVLLVALLVWAALR
jgi:hypothetical protein